MSLFIYYCLNAFYWPSKQRIDLSGTGGGKLHSESKALMILLDILVLHSEITSINHLQFASLQVNFSLSIKTSEFVLRYSKGPLGTRQISLN